MRQPLNTIDKDKRNSIIVKKIGKLANGAIYEPINNDGKIIPNKWNKNANEKRAQLRSIVSSMFNVYLLIFILY